MLTLPTREDPQNEVAGLGSKGVEDPTRVSFLRQLTLHAAHPVSLVAVTLALYPLFH